MLGVMQMHPKHECLDDGRDALSFISCFRRVKIIFVKPNPQKRSHNWVNYEQFIAFVGPKLMISLMRYGVRCSLEQDV